MRHADGHCALSYNVQISTDADNGIAVSVNVGQAAPDYEYLAPAVEQIKTRLGRARGADRCGCWLYEPPEHSRGAR